MSLIKNALIRIVVFIIIVIGNIISNIYGGLFLRHHNKRTTRLEEKKFYKVLIIKLWAIGEVAMVTPVLREFKRNFPNVRISVLVGKNSADLLEKNPHVDEVIGIDEKIFLNFNLPKVYWLIKRLVSQRYNIAIVLHHFVLFNIFAWLIGAKIRVGFDRNGEGFLNTIRVKPLPEAHKVSEYLSVVEALGGKVRDDNLEIFPTRQDEDLVEDFLKKNGISKNDILIGIMPTGGENLASKRAGASLKRKTWPLEHYVRLCEMLTKKAKIIILGGQAEIDKAIAIKSRRGGNVIDGTGKLNLRQLNSLARKCDLMVTNDSGPMHVVSASQTPLIVIFGPTDPFLCGPVSKGSYIINKNLDCSPCFKGNVFPNVVSRCDKRPTCMELVSAKEVYDLIERRLQKA